MRIHTSASAMQAILSAGCSPIRGESEKPKTSDAHSAADLDVRLKQLAIDIEKARLALERRRWFLRE